MLNDVTLNQSNTIIFNNRTSCHSILLLVLSYSLFTFCMSHYCLIFARFYVTLSLSLSRPFSLSLSHSLTLSLSLSFSLISSLCLSHGFKFPILISHSLSLSLSLFHSIFIVLLIEGRSFFQTNLDSTNVQKYLFFFQQSLNPVSTASRLGIHKSFCSSLPE
jgi:hypothetical protein